MRSVWSTTAVHPVRAAVDDASTVFAGVAGSPMWSMTDTDVSDAVTALHQHLSEAHGMMVRLVGEAEIRQLPTAGGAANAVQWLRSRLLVGQGRGERLGADRESRALGDGRHRRCPGRGSDRVVAGGGDHHRGHQSEQ